MSRRKQAPKRDVLPDPIFHSALLAKFINSVMRSGKKALAEKIVYEALSNVLHNVQAKQGSHESEACSNKNGIFSQEEKKHALKLFLTALDNITPIVEVKSRRVGGSNYQVPTEIRAKRRLTLAMRWLIECSSKRNEKTMKERLANEILDILEGKGSTVKKREEVHRMAKSNQAFAHYKW